MAISSKPTSGPLGSSYIVQLSVCPLSRSFCDQFTQADLNEPALRADAFACCWPTVEVI
jgi:hypothetical protein